MEIKVEVYIKGRCPMCDNSYDLKLERGTLYKCPCGYFNYCAGDSEVSVDTHNISEKEWKRRRRKRLRATQVRKISLFGNTYEPTLANLYEAIQEACSHHQNSVQIIFWDGSKQDVAFRDNNTIGVHEFDEACLMAERLDILLDN